MNSTSRTGIATSFRPTSWSRNYTYIYIVRSETLVHIKFRNSVINLWPNKKDLIYFKARGHRSKSATFDSLTILPKILHGDVANSEGSRKRT